LILADDLGYSDLGCYGGEIDTPNIDELARGGARFTQFYTSARCCPTRASLMTGLYPAQAGIADFTTPQPAPKLGPGYLGRLRDDCVTLAEVLKPAGYACYYVGKWHMHPETGPVRRGFDEFYGYTADHSHDQYDADYYVRLPEGRKKEIDPPQGEFYATDVFNQYAVEFLRQGQQSGKPWLLLLAHSSPHFPVQAHALRQGDWKVVWSKRMPTEIRWELYNIAEDRCETNNLAAIHPERVEQMAARWEAWARHVGVVYDEAAVSSTPSKTGDSAP
jgi:arylsulfatase